MYGAFASFFEAWKPQSLSLQLHVKEPAQGVSFWIPKKKVSHMGVKQREGE